MSLIGKNTVSTILVYDVCYDSVEVLIDLKLFPCENALEHSVGCNCFKFNVIEVEYDRLLCLVLLFTVMVCS